MRVLIAHSFYRVPGGEDRYTRQQVELLGREHEVHLLERTNSELDEGIGTAARMAFSGRSRAEVEDTIDAFKPDVIHLHNAYPAWGPAVHLAAERRGVPLVMTVHNFRLRCPNSYMYTKGAPCRRCEGGAYTNGLLHNCFPSVKQAFAYTGTLWLHRFVLKLERKVDAFIAPSRFMHDRLIEWGLDPGKVLLIRNFTEVPLGSAIPGSFGLSVGRLSSEKGLEDLLHALRLAGDPPFTIVGDGPLRARLLALVEDLGLVNTELPGRLPPERVAPLLREARFVTLPSVWDENAPLAALEAMAAGRPLLVSHTGGLPELVEGGAGLICRPGDAADIAAKVRRLMDDAELCRRAGAAALAMAEAEFDPGVHLRRLEAAYEGVTASAKDRVGGPAWPR
jgi:glycosyltransferase involved in cell wall biosynthesis